MFKIDCKENAKLKTIVDLVNSDDELSTLWKCSNINAIDRLGITDHGPMHMKIVTSYALDILRLLVEGGVEPSCVSDHGLDSEDAEVIVALASMMHDLGISVHRDRHEEHSLFLASGFLNKMLPAVYEEIDKRTIVKSEILHAIIAHSKKIETYTIEAGIVKLSDALDMEKDSVQHREG